MFLLSTYLIAQVLCLAWALTVLQSMLTEDMVCLLMLYAYLVSLSEEHL
ncbi:hypothetical protein [Pseudoalteromonas sp. A25]|nr:hypothetical protein [Pseudoalteromonas sp. A25]